MTISSNSGGLRPGVCTSTARPLSPYEGMVIYETDTNRVLVYDNSAWVMIADTDQPPGIQLISTTSFASAADVQINNCFPTEFTRFRIIFSLNNTSAGTRYAHFRLSASGTPVTTGYYSKSVWWSMSSAGSTASDSDYRNDRFCLGPHGGSNSQPMMASVDIYQPNVAAHTSMNMVGSGAYYGVYFAHYFGGGSHTTNSVYDGIYFFTTGDTVTGSISVYGYRS